MNEKLENLLTNVLTFFGGTLITMGIVDEGMLNEVVGAVITLCAFVITLIKRRKDGIDQENS